MIRKMVMRVNDLIKMFCEENSDRYILCEKYSCNHMSEQTCIGIIVKKGFSHMEMLVELTSYMDEAGLCDSELEFSEGLLIEDFDEDIIVCFPNIITGQGKQNN